MQALILASTSPYRRELLERLGLPFTTANPAIDESPKPGESAEALATRLAASKAKAVADRLTSDHQHGADRIADWIIIGSDQVAACGEQLLGKPGDVDSAVEQLLSMSGRAVSFHTAVHLLSASSRFTAVDQTTVVMRNLSRSEIERYVAKEPALDCAGSFKVEGLGISLFSEIRTSDPTGLVGLPLIATSQGLRELGVELP